MAGDTKWIGGSAKIKKLKNKEWKETTIVNLSLKKEDLDKLVVNDKGYVYVDLIKKKEKDKYDNDFSICENWYMANKILEERGGSDDMDDDVEDDPF